MIRFFPAKLRLQSCPVAVTTAMEPIIHSAVINKAIFGEQLPAI